MSAALVERVFELLRRSGAPVEEEAILRLGKRAWLMLRLVPPSAPGAARFAEGGIICSGGRVWQLGQLPVQLWREVCLDLSWSYTMHDAKGKHVETKRYGEEG